MTPGFGVALHLAGRHQGRHGWMGGQGTDFFVDPDGTVGVLLTQVGVDSECWPLITDFQELPPLLPNNLVVDKEMTAG